MYDCLRSVNENQTCNEVLQSKKETVCCNGTSRGTSHQHHHTQLMQVPEPGRRGKRESDTVSSCKEWPAVYFDVCGCIWWKTQTEHKQNAEEENKHYNIKVLLPVWMCKYFMRKNRKLLFIQTQGRSELWAVKEKWIQASAYHGLCEGWIRTKLSSKTWSCHGGCWGFDSLRQLGRKLGSGR